MLNMHEALVPVPGSPLLITNMQAGWPTPAWASDEHKAKQTSYEFMPLYLQVQNAGQQVVHAYRVMVARYDAFGEYIDTIRATSVTYDQATKEGLAPQGTDYGRWSLRVQAPYLTGTALLYVDAVRFSDGSVWRADPQAVLVRAPSAAPGIRFHSWHVVPDPREVLPRQIKDPG